MAYQIFTLPKQTNFNSSADLLSGARAHFYLTGTSTPTSVYADSALATPLSNPVVADTAGVFAQIFMDPAIVYRMVLKTSAGVELYTSDPANEQVLSQSVIGRLLYPITEPETTAGITITDFSRQPGDVHRYGVIGDGVTNDGPAIQAVFTMALTVGGYYWFDGTKTYKVNDPLTLLNSVTPPTQKPINIDYRGCLFDFTSLTGSQIAIRYGATSLANSHAAQMVRVGNLRMLGPEENGYPQVYADLLTSTTGVSLEYCTHWTFDPHQVLAFFKAFKTATSWSNTHYNHHFRNCYQGLHLAELSTFSNWYGCNFLQCSVGILFRGVDTVARQNFFGGRCETNDVHVHVDADPGFAGSTLAVRDIFMDGMYLEAASQDWLRIGMDYDETALSSVRQATNTQGTTANFVVRAPYFANNSISPATAALLCFDKDDLLNAKVRAFSFDGPASLRQRCRGRPSQSNWRTTVNVFHTTDELESFEIGEGEADLTMTSGSVTLGRSVGNILSVAHVSNGVFDVTFREAYSAAAEYSLGGSAEGAFWVSRANTSTTVCRVTVRDAAGAAAFAATLSIWVTGRMQ